MLPSARTQMNRTSPREVIFCDYRRPSFWLFVGVFGGLFLLGIFVLFHSLGGGLALCIVNGLIVWGVIHSRMRPPVYATLAPDFLSIPSQSLRIGWNEIVDARRGSRIVGQQPDYQEEVSLLTYPPLILRVRSTAAAASGRTPLADGTVELLIDTAHCGIPADELVARIRAAGGLPVNGLPVPSDSTFSHQGATTGLTRIFFGVWIFAILGLGLMGTGIYWLVRQRGEPAGPWAFIAFGIVATLLSIYVARDARSARAQDRGGA